MSIYWVYTYIATLYLKLYTLQKEQRNESTRIALHILLHKQVMS